MSTGAAVLAYVVVTGLLALIPWLIAQSALAVMPNRRSPKDRRTYRQVTAAAAGLMSMTPAGFAVALLASIYLTVHWHWYVRTPKGAYLLASAKAEQRRAQQQANRMYELPKDGW